MPEPPASEQVLGETHFSISAMFERNVRSDSSAHLHLERNGMSTLRLADHGNAAPPGVIFDGFSGLGEPELSRGAPTVLPDHDGDDATAVITHTATGGGYDETTGTVTVNIDDQFECPPLR